MADNTRVGIMAIVIIVMVAAFYFSALPARSASTPSNTVGSAIETGVSEDVCEPARFCDGSKLHIVRDDCSVNFAYCKSGCHAGKCLS